MGQVDKAVRFVDRLREHFPAPDFRVESQHVVSRDQRLLRISTMVDGQQFCIDTLIDNDYPENADHIIAGTEQRFCEELASIGKGNVPVPSEQAQEIIALCRVCGFELVGRSIIGEPAQYYARVIGEGKTPIYPVPEYWFGRDLKFWQYFLASIKVTP